MKTKKELLAYVVVFCVFLIVSPNIASALPHCEDLATNPDYGLAGNPVVKEVTSAIVISGSLTYCQVDIKYGTNLDQNINIRVGLPLNSADGGTDGVEGAWYGRTQGIGGGG